MRSSGLRPRAVRDALRGHAYPLDISRSSNKPVDQRQQQNSADDNYFSRLLTAPVLARFSRGGCGFCLLRRLAAVSEAGLILFGCFQTIAGYIEFDNDAVVNETVNRGGGGHSIANGFIMPLPSMS